MTFYSALSFFIPVYRILCEKTTGRRIEVRLSAENYKNKRVYEISVKSLDKTV